MRVSFQFFLLVLAISVSGSGLAAKPKIVCWSDDAGRRACGDRVPPKYAKQEQLLYDDSGRVRDKRARQMTSEEAKALADSKRAEEARQRQAMDQQRYDRFLLQTYETEGDLVRAKENRLAIIDSRLALAEKTRREMGEQLQVYSNLEKGFLDRNQPVPAKTTDQISKFAASHSEALISVNTLTDERKRVDAKFNDDIRRYRELKSGK